MATSYIDSLRLGTKTSSTTSSTTTTGSQSIDQSGFLKLLTTQMTNQDPTSPMDTSTMVQQLSEMSSVSGITEMNASLKSLVSEMTGNRIGDAASWIGKAALISSDAAQPLSNGGYAGQITLPSATTATTVSLVDASGNTVWSKDLGAQKAGTVDFGWDGKLSDGTAETQPLQVVVSAVGSSGSVTADTATWATVTGVNSPAGGSAAQLTTTLGNFDPTAVLSLS